MPHPPAPSAAATAHPGTGNPLAPHWLPVPDDANTLPATVWPRSAQRAGEEVSLGGVPVSALAARYGTPLFVVDEQDARQRAAEALAAFRGAFARIGSDARVYYAGKAFLSIDVARWMRDAGLHLDVCSGGELAVALAAGIDPALLGYHGNNKSVAEIDRAVQVGVGAIVLDSTVEVERVVAAAQRYGRVQPVRLRVNSGVHASTHEYLATAREDQKFGIPLAETPAVVQQIRSTGQLAFLGLHSHIGSQIFGTGGFEEAAGRLLTVHAELLSGGTVPELNLGGGFGIAYTDQDDPTPLPLMADLLADVVAATCRRLRIPAPVIAVEPGRAIIGPSTVTLYTVGTVKDVEVSLDRAAAGVSTITAPTRKYVSVDGGMSDNLRPALYGAQYSARIASRTSSEAPALVRVVGKHCESGDVLVHADYLPGDIRPGDLLGVPATGAYCWSLASNYNYLGRPPVVTVLAGEDRVLVRGETEADVLSRDAGVRE